MLCVYCKHAEADAREHYLPQCLGRFENFDPLLDRLCSTCNHEIGSTVEREFCRKSPEAVLRSTNWIKGQNAAKKNRAPAHLFQPERIGGQHVYFFAPDPESGIDILWQTDKQPGTVKEISQVVILDKEGHAAEHIPIPTEITTASELVEILYKKRNATVIERALLIAASGDETRIQKLFSTIKLTVSMQRRSGGPVPRQFFTAEVTTAYFRALAKIGFHYALKYIPTIRGDEGAFRPLRDFIRDGIGEGSQFLSTCESVSNTDGPPGHLLTSLASPNANIVVNMQFFVGCRTTLPQWRLTLGPNPTTLLLNQTSAHFFAYAQDHDGRLKGGAIIALQIR
jgi:hypothetical protein